MNWTPWRRNQDTNSVPAEVQDYYQSERRERVGVAWLLAVGTLLATLAIVIALFFGGRWVWRALFGTDDKKTPTTTQQQTGDQDKKTPSGTDAAEPTPSAPSGSSAPTSPGTSSTSTTTPSAPAPATPQAGQPTPSTPTPLVNTGPGDETGM